MSISDEEVFHKFDGVLITQDNIEHYRGLLREQFLINRCQDCGYWIYPHRPMCPECWSWDVKPTEASGEGFVYMFTLIYQGDGANPSSPHPVVAVELAEQEGLRYLSTIVGPDVSDIEIGRPVTLVWTERHGNPAPTFELTE